MCENNSIFFINSIFNHKNFSNLFLFGGKGDNGHHYFFLFFENQLFGTQYKKDYFCNPNDLNTWMKRHIKF